MEFTQKLPSGRHVTRWRTVIGWRPSVRGKTAISPPFCHFADLIYVSTDSSTFQLSIGGRFKFLRPVVVRRGRGNDRDLGVWFSNPSAKSTADISTAFHRIRSRLIPKWCPRPPLSNKLNLEQIRQNGEDLEALKVADFDEKSRFHLHTSLRVGSFLK